MRVRSASLAVLSVLLVAGVILFASCARLRCIVGAHSTHESKDLRINAAIDGWKLLNPSVDGLTVYVKGETSDPPILLLHEIPGLLPETVRFADQLVDHKYHVYMPLFFGSFSGRIGAVRQMLEVCGGHDFNCLSADESPVVAKLKDLRDRIAEDHKDHKQRMGIIGMCLTGGMPLSLVNDNVAAVVLSQPAVPFPLTDAKRHSLGADLGPITDPKNETAVLGIRFDKDCLAVSERFEDLQKKIESRLDLCVVTSKDEHAHSVLTVEGHNLHFESPQKQEPSTKKAKEKAAREKAAHDEAQKAISHAFLFLGKYLKQENGGYAPCQSPPISLPSPPE
jgi:dienelactone hydrolase